MYQKSTIPKKYHPKGFEILHEDNDIIVGIKAAGFLTVAALWNKDKTIHSALNEYVRKGNSKSRKCVYVVHRLDQDTSGILVFAKTETAQIIIKDNWKSAQKIYYAVVHGHFRNKSGIISSYLVEDDEYRMHTTTDEGQGKLAQTQYETVKEVNNFSLMKITLLTGRKNQIRIHFFGEGHPVVGDEKYREGPTRFKRLALHAYSLSLTHPKTHKRLTFQSDLPEYFKTLVGDIKL